MDGHSDSEQVGKTEQSGQTGQAERRHMVRWRINKDVQVKLAPEDASVPCNIENINLKGMKIASSKELLTGDNTVLIIDIDKGFCLDKIGVKVLWRTHTETGNTYGLCFTKIKDSDRELIHSYVRGHFPKEISRQLWRGVN